MKLPRLHGASFPCLAALLAWACGESAVQVTEEAPAAAAAEDVSSTEAQAPEAPRVLDLGDGLTVEVLTEGQGETAHPGSEISIDYEARLKDASEPFASTHDLWRPPRVVLSRSDRADLLPALSRALDGLRAGTKARVHVPAALAYGKQGLPSSGVPADADLVIDLDLLEVRR